MGKVSPHNQQLKSGRQKRRSRTGNKKHLKPDTITLNPHSKAFRSKSCSNIGNKRVGVLNAEQSVSDNVEILQNNNNRENANLSPARLECTPIKEALAVFNQNNLQSTPKTPLPEGSVSESRLESLPNELLVKILCHLHHDQLRPVFHVSRRIRKAVITARKFHFNYKTPDRTRQEMLKTRTPLATERWPFISKKYGKGAKIPTPPHTPKAPRHGPRPPSRLKFAEMRQISAVLFQEPSYSSKCTVPSVVAKPISKSLASNRVLFYEDELCQAVAQNNLR